MLVSLWLNFLGSLYLIYVSLGFTIDDCSQSLVDLVFSFFQYLRKVFNLLKGEINLERFLIRTLITYYQRHIQIIISTKELFFQLLGHLSRSAYLCLLIYLQIQSQISISQQSQKQMQCPTHVKKLEKITDDRTDPCEICGRAAAFQCKSCPFVQCEECRICNKRHGLIKIIDLNKVKPEYSYNGYSCNSCSKSKTVDDDGIWHCNTCNYDLCPDCAE